MITDTDLFRIFSQFHDFRISSLISPGFLAAAWAWIDPLFSLRQRLLYRYLHALRHYNISRITLSTAALRSVKILIIIIIIVLTP